MELDVVNITGRRGRMMSKQIRSFGLCREDRKMWRTGQLGLIWEIANEVVPVFTFTYTT